MMLKITLLFLVYIARPSSACKLMEVTRCTNYDLVGHFNFPVFIPRDEWEQTCTKMRVVLDCVYQPEFVDGCTIADTYFYDMQRDSSYAVCNDGEYLKHVDCLGNEVMKKKGSDCIQPLSGDTGCQVIESARACITNAVLTSCGEDDSKYTDTLAYRFLAPFANYSNCEIAGPDNMMTTTKAPVVTTSLTQETPSHQTTTIDTGNNTTTSGAASVLTVPSFLISVVLANLFVLFHNPKFL